MFGTKSVFNSLNFNDFRNKKFLNTLNNLDFKALFPLKTFENNYFKLSIIDSQNNNITFIKKKKDNCLVYKFWFLRINIIWTLFIIFWFYISSETILEFTPYILYSILYRIKLLNYFINLQFLNFYNFYLYDDF